MHIFVTQILISKKVSRFVLFAITITAIGGTAVWSIHYFFLTDYFHYSKPEGFFSPIFFYKTLDLVYVAAFPLIFKLQQFYHHQEKQNREIIEQKLNAELELLKNQLQPHFLFNTLNNLYGMILTQDKNTAKAVLHLSSMMNYMLYDCSGQTILLEKEIEHLKNYIELEKIRYGKRLTLSFEYGGDLNNKHIAPLLLFGFIENAFKHGVGKDDKDAWIRINCWVKKKSLDFFIENSLAIEEKKSPSNNGIGLKNIQMRLNLIYPNQHVLKIEFEETFLVHLILKL
jgi:two-component system, LytTR family, sensor kinase